MINNSYNSSLFSLISICFLSGSKRFLLVPLFIKDFSFSFDLWYLFDYSIALGYWLDCHLIIIGIIFSFFFYGLFHNRILNAFRKMSSHAVFINSTILFFCLSFEEWIQRWMEEKWLLGILSSHHGLFMISLFNNEITNGVAIIFLRISF